MNMVISVKSSLLIAVASTIATKESALNKNKKLQELARQTAERALNQLEYVTEVS